MQLRYLHISGLHLSAQADLGQTARAIESYEQALVIDQEIGDRRGDGVRVGKLGNRYAELEHAARAIELYEQALAIHSEIGDRGGEGNVLSNQAEVLIDAGRYVEAVQRALEGARTGEEISSANLGC